MYYKIKYQGVAFVECENEEQAQELFDNKEYFMNTIGCLLYTSPSPRDPKTSRMPSSA